MNDRNREEEEVVNFDDGVREENFLFGQLASEAAVVKTTHIINSACMCEC